MTVVFSVVRVKLHMKMLSQLFLLQLVHHYYTYFDNVIYCRYGNICEVLIFVNFARRTNSRIQESPGNYYYNIATKEEKFVNYKQREKSKNKKFSKIKTREMIKFTVRYIPVYNAMFFLSYSCYKKAPRIIH